MLAFYNGAAFAGVRMAGSLPILPNLPAIMNAYTLDPQLTNLLTRGAPRPNPGTGITCQQL